MGIPDTHTMQMSHRVSSKDPSSLWAVFCRIRSWTFAATNFATHVTTGESANSKNATELHDDREADRVAHRNETNKRAKNNINDHVPSSSAK